MDMKFDESNKLSQQEAVLNFNDSSFLGCQEEAPAISNFSSLSSSSCQLNLNSFNNGHSSSSLCSSEHSSRSTSPSLLPSNSFNLKEKEEEGVLNFIDNSDVLSSSSKEKRKQVKNACVNCQKACKKCDNARPCERCVKYGLASSCKDSERKERKRGLKRGPYNRNNSSNRRGNAALINTAQFKLVPNSSYEPLFELHGQKQSSEAGSKLLVLDQVGEDFKSGNTCLTGNELQHQQNPPNSFSSLLFPSAASSARSRLVPPACTYSSNSFINMSDSYCNDKDGNTTLVKKQNCEIKSTNQSKVNIKAPSSAMSNASFGPSKSLQNDNTSNPYWNGFLFQTNPIEARNNISDQGRLSGPTFSPQDMLGRGSPNLNPPQGNSTQYPQTKDASTFPPFFPQESVLVVGDPFCGHPSSSLPRSSPPVQVYGEVNANNGQNNNFQQANKVSYLTDKENNVASSNLFESKIVREPSPLDQLSSICCTLLNNSGK